MERLLSEENLNGYNSAVWKAIKQVYDRGT